MCEADGPRTRIMDLSGVGANHSGQLVVGCGMPLFCNVSKKAFLASLVTTQADEAEVLALPTSCVGMYLTVREHQAPCIASSSPR